MSQTTFEIKSPAQNFDVASCRSNFPILSRTVNDHPLTYLDNAATTQKPQSVIDRLSTYYREENSNVHRGVHFLSQLATDAYENSRETVRRFVNARTTKEIIFTSGTTDSINLVTATFGRSLGAGDRVLISAMEHHANIVPWQMLCEATGAILDVARIEENGELNFDSYEELLSLSPKIVSIVYASNSLGTINPVRDIVSKAHERGIPVLLDAAQMMVHDRVDVQELDCDFMCFSAHKMLGPTGVGVLYGKEQLLDSLPPYRGGGDMIDTVSFAGTTYADLPNRLEAGTPNIAGVIGLGAAIEYLEALPFDAVRVHEENLLKECTEELATLGGITLVGTASNKVSVVSFNIDSVHPYDAGTILDKMGVAVRTGHHCTMPLMERLKQPGTIRASFAFYNNRSDIDALIEAVSRAKSMLVA